METFITQFYCFRFGELCTTSLVPRLFQVRLLSFIFQFMPRPCSQFCSQHDHVSDNLHVIYLGGPDSCGFLTLKVGCARTCHVTIEGSSPFYNRYLLHTCVQFVVIIFLYAEFSLKGLRFSSRSFLVPPSDLLFSSLSNLLRTESSVD